MDERRTLRGQMRMHNIQCITGLGVAVVERGVSLQYILSIAQRELRGNIFNLLAQLPLMSLVYSPGQPSFSARRAFPSSDRTPEQSERGNNEIAIRAFASEESSSEARIMSEFIQIRRHFSASEQFRPIM